ncbi:MAG: transposase [Cetobacterium sp.]
MARKSYSPEFKFSIVLEALKERKTLQEIASEHGIAPSQISRWVDEFKSSGSEVFSRDNKSAKRMELLEAEQYELYAKIGKLTASNDWLKKKLEKLGG